MLSIKRVISSIAIVTMMWASSAHASFKSYGVREAKQSTPISDVDLIKVLKTSHIDINGRLPSRSRLAMAWAQVALENGEGTVVWNHNLGNIGPSYGQRHAYYVHSPKANYRSFESFDEGARAYWITINRCEIVLKLFDAGLPREATESLKACGYFTANTDMYANLMTSLYYRALKKVIPDEERRQQRELTERAWHEYQFRTSFTPKCGCSKFYY